MSDAGETSGRRELLRRLAIAGAAGAAVSTLHSSEVLAACGPSVGYLQFVRTDAATTWTYSGGGGALTPTNNATPVGTGAFNAIFGTVGWKNLPNLTLPLLTLSHTLSTTFTITGANRAKLCVARFEVQGDRTVQNVTLNGTTIYSVANGTGNDFNFPSGIQNISLANLSLFTAGPNTIRMSFTNDGAIFFGARFALRLES